MVTMGRSRRLQGVFPTLDDVPAIKQSLSAPAWLNGGIVPDATFSIPVQQSGLTWESKADVECRDEANVTVDPTLSTPPSPRERHTSAVKVNDLKDGRSSKQKVNPPATNFPPRINDPQHSIAGNETVISLRSISSRFRRFLSQARASIRTRNSKHKTRLRGRQDQKQHKVEGMVIEARTIGSTIMVPDPQLLQKTDIPSMTKVKNQELALSMSECSILGPKSAYIAPTEVQLPQDTLYGKLLDAVSPKSSATQQAPLVSELKSVSSSSSISWWPTSSSDSSKEESVCNEMDTEETGLSPKPRNGLRYVIHAQRKEKLPASQKRKMPTRQKKKIITSVHVEEVAIGDDANAPAYEVAVDNEAESIGFNSASSASEVSKQNDEPDLFPPNAGSISYSSYSELRVARNESDSNQSSFSESREEEMKTKLSRSIQMLLMSFDDSVAMLNSIN